MGGIFHLQNHPPTPPPPPPPPSPLFPLPFFFSFLGLGGEGEGGGEGRGRGGATTTAPLERGGDKVPPLPPPDFNDFFTQGRLIWNIFLFSISLSSLCVIYHRGRSVHSSKNYKTFVILSKISVWHTSNNEILITLNFLFRFIFLLSVQ